jgi:lipoprotein-anchoring transpeptidase ErfK/SrfK
MMPARAIPYLLVGLLVAACAGSQAQPAPVATLNPTTTTTPAATTTTVEPRPVWKGYAAVSTHEPTLGAYAHGPVEVYESPTDSDAWITLEETTILGTATVLGVISSSQGGWVEVMLPIRPNGSTGWVRTDDVSLYVVDSEIVVDLTKKRLTYMVDGVEVLKTDVGIGSAYNQTPPGDYFVTDNVTLADPNSPWGPHALGLSARSDTITEFNGGDGIIGIHGTNNPNSIGDSISLGCIRVPNEKITLLHEMVPLGTRVTVKA